MPSGVLRWSRRIGIFLAVLVLTVLLVGILVRQIVVPWFIGSRVTGAISNYWHGTVDVRQVRFRFTGPLDLVGLRMEDPTGRGWVEVDEARVHLDNWPSLSPVVRTIEVNRATIQYNLDRPLPIRRPPEPPEPTDLVDIHRVTIRELFVSVRYGPDSLALDTMRVAAYRPAPDAPYQFEALPVNQADARLFVAGSLNPDTWEVDARGQLDREMATTDFRVLGNILGIELPARQASGRLRVEATVAGLLNDFRQLNVNATATVANAGARITDGMDVSGLEALVTMQDWQLQVESLRFATMDGTVTAQATLDLTADPTEYIGRVRLDRLDVGQIGQAAMRRELTGGTVNLGVRFNGSGNVMNARGWGRVDAELAVGPLRQAGGPLRFDVRMLRHDDGWRPDVRAQLRGWSAGTQDALLIENLQGSMRAEGGRLELREATATVAGGLLYLEADGILPQGGVSEATQLRARIRIEDALLQAIVQAFGSEEGPEGTLHVESTVDLRLGPVASVASTGRISVDLAGEAAPHVTGGYALAIEDLPEEGEPFVLAGELMDWTYSTGGAARVMMPTAHVEFREDRWIVADARVLTHGGQLLAGGESWLRADGVREYSGQFETRDFDVAALGPWTGHDRPVVTRLNLAGTFSGQGRQRLGATGAGDLLVMSPRQEGLLARGLLTLDVTGEDLEGPGAMERLVATLRWEDVDVLRGQEVIVHDLQAQADVRGDLRVDGQLIGEGMGGHFSAGVRITRPEGQFTHISRIRMQQLDLSQIPLIAWAPEEVMFVRLSGELIVSGSDFSAVRVRGEGRADARLDLPTVQTAGGEWLMDLRFEGLDAGVWPRVLGQAELVGWELDGPRVSVAQNLRASILAMGHSADMSSFRGDLLGGRAHGLFRFDFEPFVPMVFRGGITVRDLQLAQASKLIEGPEGIEGAADMSYHFAGSELTLHGINAQGALSVRNSQMLGEPVIQSVLVNLGQAPGAASRTDLDVVFSQHGPLLTIRSARVATPVVALTIRPGSTAHLETRALNLTIVAAPLQDLQSLVNVPLLESIIPMVTRMTEIHVGGTWHSRDTLDISPLPVRGIAEGMADFFRDAARTGGDMGRAVLHPFAEMTP